MAVNSYRRGVAAPGPAPGLRDAQPASMAGLAQLGEGLGRVGAVLQDASERRQLNDARLAMIEGFGAFDRDLVEDQGFGDMRQRYGQRIDKLQADIVGQVESETLAGQLQVEFARMATVGRARAQQRAFQLEQNHAIGTAQSGLRQLTDLASQADDQRVAQAYFDQADAMVGELVQAGFLAEDRAEALRADFDTNVSRNSAGRLILDDPARAVEVLGQEGALGLSEADRISYLGKAQVQARIEAERVDRGFKRQVDFAITQLTSGENVAELDGLIAAAEGSEYFGPLVAAREANQTLGGFYAVPPAERRAHIAAIEQRGVANADEKRFLDTLRAIDANAAAEMARDPHGYAAKAQIAGSGPLDLADQKSVETRIADADTLAAEYGAPLRYFSDAEKAAFSDTISGGSVDDKLALVASIADGFGDRAHGAFDELGEKDRLVGHIGHLVAATGDREVATLMLRGMEMRAAGDEMQVENLERSEVAAEVIGGALNHAPPGLRETILEGAKAYFAARAPGRVDPQDLSGATQLFQEAVQAAAGQVSRGGETLGGIQEVNGVPALLPPTLSAGLVESAIENANPNTWMRASHYGGPPLDGAERILPDDDVVLQAIPGGRYLVGVERRGRIEYLRDDAAPSGLFALDLEALVAAAPDAPPGLIGRLNRGVAEWFGGGEE